MPVSMSRSVVPGLLAAVLVTACERSAESDGTPPQQSSAHLRIVSLSPGITATVVALGAGDRLVGRTPWCEGVDATPIVGSLLDLDAEAIVRAHPQVVLAQPPAQGESRGLGELAQENGWRVESFQLNSLADLSASVERLPSAICDPGSPDDRAELEARASDLRNKLAELLKPLPSARAAGRTLVILAGSESADSLAFGKGTYLGDVLDSWGIESALTRSGYPALGAEDIVRIAPDSVIVLGGRRSEAAKKFSSLLPRTRIVQVDAPQLMQPGAGFIAALEVLRGAVEKATVATAPSAPTSEPQ